MIKTRIIAALLMPFLLTMTACEQWKNNNTNEDGLGLTSDYSGYLEVRYTNVYPPWDESVRLDATINQELETIIFETGSLSYQGDTLVSADSKIVRSGTWQITPVGFMEKAGENISVEVDAGVSVTGDIQEIYAKDQSGNWVMVNQTDLSADPYSTVVFDLITASVEGDTQGISLPTGSILFTLFLLPI